MPIHFDERRWARVRDAYGKFYAGELERPVIGVELAGADAGRPQPDTPLLSQETCHDFSHSPEAVIDRIDWELSRRRYLGDAFPYFNMDCFGPGVAAAFLGGRLDNSSGRVWFYPPADLPIQDIHFTYDPENPWLQRIKALYKAGMERWQGQVLMGMTDLGGNLDILSTFRPSEKLLMDLYDAPEEVERLLNEAHQMWHRFYEELNAVLQPVNPGYSDWGAMYSPEPGYMLQCDFSYMISPKMFKKFALPELAATCKRIPNCFYHLDGVGQIIHLDMLLSIPELKGIQWVPGDGKPDSGQWPELHQKIHAAGKRIQITYGGFEATRAVIGQIGSSKGVQLKTLAFPAEEEAGIRAELASFGVGV